MSGRFRPAALRSVMNFKSILGDSLVEYDCASDCALEPRNVRVAPDYQLPFSESLSFPAQPEGCVCRRDRQIRVANA